MEWHVKIGKAQTCKNEKGINEIMDASNKEP